MYTLVFNANTIQDLWDHHPNNPNRPLGQKSGRQLFGTVVTPDCGVFTTGTNPSPKLTGTETTIPKIVCPYQVNDIIAIQEKWARSGDGYVYYDYNNETNNQGYTFRPAATMPLDATRMYARIVSTRVWSITQEIRDKYINAGVNTDSAAGTAAVVGYADKALELLSSIRNSHNNAALASTYQPLVPITIPTRTEPQPYVMYQKLRPSVTINGTTYYAADYSIYAQAYNNVNSIKDSGDGHPIDPVNHGAWYATELDNDYTDLRGAYGAKNTRYPNYIKVGMTAWTWEGNTGTWPLDPEDPSSEQIPYDLGTSSTEITEGGSELPTVNGSIVPRSRITSGSHVLYGPNKFVWNGISWQVVSYIYLTTSKGSDGRYHPIPITATFNANHTDPSQHLFTWMISAYLCDETGKIYGNWYGKNFQA